MSPVRSDSFRFLLLLLLSLLAACGAAFLLASLIPFEFLNSFVGSFAFDGNAGLFTHDFFSRATFFFRAAGAACLISGAVLYFGRKRIEKPARESLSALASSFVELGRSLAADMREEDKTHILALFFIVLAGLALRLAFLFEPILYDEAHTFVQYASRPLFIGLSDYSAPNNHLFHTLLVHAACLIFGDSVEVIRLPALAAGVALVPSVYWAARIICNKYAGLLSAVFVCASSVLVDYSVNARGYSLIGLIFILLTVLGNYLKQKRSPAGWLLFSLLSALGFYTIPIMLYPFSAVVIWLLLSAVFNDFHYSRRYVFKDLFAAVILTAVLTLLLYAPVFAVSGLKSVIANRFILLPGPEGYLTSLNVSLFAAWHEWNRDLPAVVKFFLAAGLFLYLLFYRRLSRERVAIIWGVLAVCLLQPLIHRVLVPPRVWMFLAPLYFGLAVSGWCLLVKSIEKKVPGKTSLAVSAASVVLVCWFCGNVLVSDSIASSRSLSAFKDAEKVTLFLRNELSKGDKIVVPVPGNAPLMYYFHVKGVPGHYFANVTAVANRLFVVVKKKSETVENLLSESALTGYGTPVLVKAFESAEIYRVERSVPGIAEAENKAEQ